jgi:hypothetical protein
VDKSAKIFFTIERNQWLGENVYPRIPRFHIVNPSPSASRRREQALPLSAGKAAHKFAGTA